MIKPKLLIIAGPNGTGKTSLTDKILKHEWTEGCEYINPDIIARDKFGDWNSDDAVLNAARWATNLREKYLAEKKNFIFETVLSAADKVIFIETARLTTGRKKFGNAVSSYKLINLCRENLIQ